MRSLSSAVARAIEAFEQVGHGGRCAACRQRIRPTQRARIVGRNLYHVRCLRGERRVD